MCTDPLKLNVSATVKSLFVAWNKKINNICSFAKSLDSDEDP